MAMQTDVKSSHLNASGVLLTSRSRIMGYQLLSGGTAGQIDFYDNSTTNSGTVRLSVDISTNTAAISTLIPGEGILFYNGVYVVLPTGAAITVFYG